ncbi:MAG: YceI family protein [Verrucomicrobiota bacterium]|jgi:polyisoprenoid-binding protein YceI
MKATEPKTYRSGIAALAAGAAALLLAGPAAAQPVRYEAQPTGSKVKMEGTSTIHDWTVESTNVGGFIEADSNFPESALTDAKAARPRIQVSIPVASLKSYADAMDEVMEDHLNMDKYPRIEYRLIELKPKSAAGTAGPLKFDAVGALTVSGTTRTNTMPVTIERMDKTKIKVAGSTPLKMTDFDVVPPAPRILGMPTIKTGDDIKISFEWVTEQKTSKEGP